MTIKSILIKNILNYSIFFFKYIYVMTFMNIWSVIGGSNRRLIERSFCFIRPFSEISCQQFYYIRPLRIWFRHSWSPEDETQGNEDDILFSAPSKRLTFLALIKISPQLLNGLPWHLVQTYVCPQDEF